jgi:hypothetical protein
MDELVEVYWAVWDCPAEGCGFIFRFDLCRSEDEGRAILMQISRLHGRQRHGSQTYFDPDIQVIEKHAFRAAERRPLDN